MPKFKIGVSKNHKKYSIVLNASSEIEAKKKVHKEGYSILNVEEFDSKIEGHKFFFEATDKNGLNKKGKVVAQDPFKVYVKLREGLKYRVNFLYSELDKDKSEGIKLDLVKHLEEQYSLYKSHSIKNRTSEEKKVDAKKEKKNLENFYLKKELDETYRLIDLVLIKIRNVLENSDNSEVDEEKKLKLESLYNGIIKIKKSTNITKLREVGELALKKIGALELEVLEKYKDANSKKLLKETNSLLKKIGSKEQFIEKDKDISYLFGKFLEYLRESFSNLIPDKKKKKQGIDKESLSYWKTELLIKKYNNRQRQNTLNIIKQFYLFLFPFGENKEKIDELFIRRKVINQNITILKAKKTGKLVSYTKIIKGYKGVVEYFILFLQQLNNYVLFVIYLFGVVFLLYLVGVKLDFIEFSINIGGIFIFIYLILASILVLFSRGVLSLAINLALFGFLFILGVVNF